MPNAKEPQIPDQAQCLQELRRGLKLAETLYFARRLSGPWLPRLCPLSNAVSGWMATL
jgi:hypothetical protein